LISRADTQAEGTVVALCGGIGGAKLALGLSHAVPGEQLLIAVNTGDDFEHLDLHVSPDIDTVMYTLAGVANPETGWGRADESWNFMEALGGIGGETWFSLGDRDLALHVERTRRLRAGESLSAITAHFCRNFGLGMRIIPMSDDRVRTLIDTGSGLLPFQNYFVERQCAPAVKSVTFDGAQTASVQSELETALQQGDLRAVVICPSNPYLSIDPILAVAGMRDLLRETSAPVVVVSPVVGGTAVKGPMAKIMGELGLEVTHAAIADHYAGLVDGLMIDCPDDGIAGGVVIAVENTMMRTLDDRIALARCVLEFADQLALGRDISRERIA
jgi:LPPG:FO 2-phospho-L-lactate transferase